MAKIHDLVDKLKDYKPYPLPTLKLTSIQEPSRGPTVYTIDEWKVHQARNRNPADYQFYRYRRVGEAMVERADVEVGMPELKLVKTDITVADRFRCSAALLLTLLAKSREEGRVLTGDFTEDPALKWGVQLLVNDGLATTSGEGFCAELRPASFVLPPNDMPPPIALHG